MDMSNQLRSVGSEGVLIDKDCEQPHKPVTFNNTSLTNTPHQPASQSASHNPQDLPHKHTAGILRQRPLHSGARSPLNLNARLTIKRD